MKKLFALIISASMLLSFAACGNSGTDNPTDPGKDASAVETTGAAEETEAATEAPATEQEDDTATIEAQKKLLAGSWTVSGMEDFEHLTFSENGTGTYKGINDKDYSFTYTVTAEHKEYANGAPYTDMMIKLEYDNGEAEDVIFFFNEDDKLVFHNSDGGGYSGVMNFDVWGKA